MAFHTSLAPLLDERRIATLTTYSEDGLPHVTAVWFLYEQDKLYVVTGANTGKARNLRRDPRVALCVESRVAGKESGLSACGSATLLEGDAAAPIARRINAKYLTPTALAHPVVGPAFESMSELVIELRPERWISWDVGDLSAQMLGEDIDEAEFFYPLEM